MKKDTRNLLLLAAALYLLTRKSSTDPSDSGSIMPWIGGAAGAAGAAAVATETGLAADLLEALAMGLLL